MGAYTLQTTIDEKQLLSLLEQLPSEEKIKIANILRAQVAKEQWRALSKQLPDVPGISMEEIVAEVKAVRRARP
jgi:hypothetical protein